MMLQQVLQSAVDCHWLTPSRVGPMRTAVKQFSAMFGVSPEQLPPDQYHLPKEALFRFIEQHSSPDTGPSKLRNTKNNLRWLLDLAVREGWLRPPAGDPFTWRNRRRSHDRRLYRTRADGKPVTFNLYALQEPGGIGLVGRSIGLAPYQRRQREGLQVVPSAFRAEIEAYLSWCQQAYAPDRPATVQKRAITADRLRKFLLRIGGYAHHIAGIPLAEITLQCLTEPAFVQGFVSWWVNDRRGRVTQTIQAYISNLEVITRHWLKDEPRAKALKAIGHSLSNDGGPVWDKETALVPLRTLEEAGLRNYPFSAERLQGSPYKGGQYNRALYRHMQDPEHVPVPSYWAGRRWAKVGSQVMISLIIRLLVRLPMRQRCIREMRLGHNLKQLPNGSWEVYFRGTQLKIASRKHSGINVYHHPIPAELNELIDVWLTFWRPRRLPVEGSDLVFLNQEGRPLNSAGLRHLFMRAVYRITGIRSTIHLVRDSWASEYLDATGDVAGCADMLGDTVQMVLNHYAHVLKRRAQGRTASWLQTHLGAAD